MVVICVWANCSPLYLSKMSETESERIALTNPSHFYTLYFPNGKKSPVAAGNVGQSDPVQYYTVNLQVCLFFFAGNLHSFQHLPRREGLVWEALTDQELTTVPKAMSFSCLIYFIYFPVTAEFVLVNQSMTSETV